MVSLPTCSASLDKILRAPILEETNRMDLMLAVTRATMRLRPSPSKVGT